MAVVVKETVLYVRVFINVSLLLLLLLVSVCFNYMRCANNDNFIGKQTKNYDVTCENITVPLCYDHCRPDQTSPALLILYSRVTVSHSRSFYHLDNVHATEKQTISQKYMNLAATAVAVAAGALCELRYRAHNDRGISMVCTMMRFNCGTNSYKFALLKF